MTNKFGTENYKSQLGKAYDPNNSKEDKQALLKYFLELKSLKQGRVSKEVEKVIQHLNRSCNYKNNSEDNPYAHVMRHPILSTFIGGIFVLIAWHYISPYFS